MIVLEISSMSETLVLDHMSFITFCLGYIWARVILIFLYSTYC